MRDGERSAQIMVVVVVRLVMMNRGTGVVKVAARIGSFEVQKHR